MTRRPFRDASDHHDDGEVDGLRRRLLGGSAAAAILGALPLDGSATGSTGVVAPPLNLRFTHGVASGDPLSDCVILWTRVVHQHVGPSDLDAHDEEGRARKTTRGRKNIPDVPVRWEISEDEHFGRISAQGDTHASPSQGFCVKVDAMGLKPGTRYWYRFKAGSATSPIGQTRTLPVGAVEQVRLAVFSCANYQMGYFNVYAEAVKRMEANPGCYDALLHLGDYIYESAGNAYPKDFPVVPGRRTDPEKEAVKLVDYRRRYARSRADEHLQRLHQLAPMIAVWDDHEFANDAWHDGAANHQDVEGTFKKRRNAAARAWREWLPVRDTGRRLENYRGFDFGNLLSLNMLDTRLRRRKKQLALEDFVSSTDFDQDAFRKALEEQDQDLLGKKQRDWLSDRMMKSTATWQVLGQQVLMARMSLPAPLLLERIKAGLGLSLEAYGALLSKKNLTLTPKEQRWLDQPYLPYNLDAWDGYPTSRERLLSEVRGLGKNLVVLAGDSHNAWASDLQDLQGQHIGVEFATPSVTSPGLEVYLAKHYPTIVAMGFMQFVKSLRFAETSSRGYMEIRATSTECRADWTLVDTVTELEYTSRVARSLRVLPGEGEGNRRLVEV